MIPTFVYHVSFAMDCIFYVRVPLFEATFYRVMLRTREIMACAYIADSHRTAQGCETRQGGTPPAMGDIRKTRLLALRGSIRGVTYPYWHKRKILKTFLG